MNNAEQFLYTATDARSGEGSLVPQLPLTLEYQTRRVTSLGLLDTGASVNVLPHALGIQLGATWDTHGPAITLTGNLAQYGARPIVVYASVGVFPPIRLAFAWTEATDVPLILGQVNFFMEFDVCFYRAQRAFEVRPRS